MSRAQGLGAGRKVFTLGAKSLRGSHLNCSSSHCLGVSVFRPGGTAALGIWTFVTLGPSYTLLCLGGTEHSSRPGLHKPYYSKLAVSLGLLSPGKQSPLCFPRLDSNPPFASPGWKAIPPLLPQARGVFAPTLGTDRFSDRNMLTGSTVLFDPQNTIHYASSKVQHQ